MQQTNFPFEAIVHDDASTDGTAAIIREYAEKYPDIIKPIYETENQYSKHDGSLRKIMDAHMRGKYIAICEGDDYWIDPLKLQKQVDFMEGHPECGLCYTKMRNYYQKTRKFGKEWGGASVSFEDLLENNTIPTLTCLFKFDLAKNYHAEINPSSHGWLMGDYPMWLWIAHISSIAFIPEVTGIYRVLEKSASHSNNPARHIRFILSINEVKYYFASRFMASNRTIWYEKVLWYSFLLSVLENENSEWKKYLLKYKQFLADKNISGNRRQKITIRLMTLFPKFTRWLIRHYITISALNSSK